MSRSFEGSGSCHHVYFLHEFFCLLGRIFALYAEKVATLMMTPGLRPPQTLVLSVLSLSLEREKSHK